MKFESGNRKFRRIHVRYTLTNGNNEEQELILQRREKEGKWEIADFYPPEQRQPNLSRLRQKPPPD